MPILPEFERPDVLVDQLRRGAEHDRVHRADVHHVTHGGRGAAVARDRLARHRVGDVVLAEAAVLLGHGEAEEAVLAEQLEVPAREEELVVRALRVRPHLLLAQLDQERAQLLLPLGQDPVGVPLVAEAPERLVAPHLLGHAHLRRIGLLSRHRRWRPSSGARRVGRVTAPVPGRRRPLARAAGARAGRRRRRAGTARRPGSPRRAFLRLRLRPRTQGATRRS